MKKLCILIISNSSDHYDKLKLCWNRVIEKNNNKDIDIFFIETDSKSKTTYLKNETLYVNFQETHTPGMMIKTIEAYRFFMNNYEYFFRTNLSSFIIIDRLYDYIIKKNPTYSGSCLFYKNIKYSSGAGILLKNNIIFLILENVKNINFFIFEDVAIGEFLNLHNIELENIERYDIMGDDKAFMNLKILDETFHIRIKLDNRDREIDIHNYFFHNY